MKIKTVGIIKNVYYYEEGIFIKSFFEYLGYKIILSKENSIIKSLPQRCNIINTYLKNIIYIKKKCDYIIIPYNIEEKCPFLSNIRTISNLYIENSISYNVKKPITLMINSLKISKNIPRLIISYILAIFEYHRHQKKLINLQQEKERTISPKVLVVSNTLMNINISKSKYIILYSKYLLPKISFDYNPLKEQKFDIRTKQSIGSIYYYHNMVERIYIINKKHCPFLLKNYVKYLEPKIKRKISIINI